MTSKHKIRLSILTSGNPKTNPSARFRAYQLLPLFEKELDFEVAGTVIINSKLGPVSLVFNLINLIRLVMISDLLLIQKARLPCFVSRILCRLVRTIYDFDDSVFLPPPSWEKGKQFTTRRIRLNCMLRHSADVIVGNAYLAAYAQKFNDNVHVIPTVVTISHHVSADAYRWGILPQVYLPSGKKNGPELTIGWIGGGAHVQQLNQVLPALRSLQERFAVRVKVVSDREWQPAGLLVENKAWTLEDEVKDVQSFDIGLMPLDASDPYLKGKCAFKAIEYMAVGVPAVGTAVGANMEAILHGETGYLITELEEWEIYLTKLIINPQMRKRMGQSAREWVVKSYSLEAVLPQYLELLCQTR